MDQRSRTSIRTASTTPPNDSADSGQADEALRRVQGRPAPTTRPRVTQEVAA